LIGVFIAGTVVGITEETIMLGQYEPAVRGMIGQFISEESALGTIMIGEFGLFTMTVTYILGLLMPLVIGFYLFLSLFEDSGYLPSTGALTYALRLPDSGIKPYSGQDGPENVENNDLVT